MDDFVSSWIGRQKFTLLAAVSPVIAFLHIAPILRLLSFVGIFIGLIGAFRNRESLRWLSVAIAVAALSLVSYFFLFRPDLAAATRPAG